MRTGRLVGLLAAAAGALWLRARHRPRRELALAAHVPSTARTVPVGRVERTARLATVSTRAAADLAVTRARQVGAGEERRAGLEEAFHVRTATQAMQVMGEMKGALMKVGQMLSFVDAGLPEHYRQALATLQADAPPMAFELVEEVVEAELRRPVGEAFAELDPVPLAAASIGQVHRARLADGTDVAVKVQYPGVDEAIKADLDNVDLLNTILVAAFPSLDPKPVVEELRERVGEELDYFREAANQQLFGELYRDHPFIHIPAVRPERSSKRVLTMDLVGGRRWDEALAAPDDLRQQWGEVVYRFVFGSLNRHHVFNGDPHPGNYRFHDDGSVTFLDFGCVKRFTAEHMATQRAMVRAVVDGDAPALRQRLVDLGFLPAGDSGDPAEYLAWFRTWYQPVLTDDEFTYTSEFAEAAVRSNFDPTSEFGHLQRRFNMPRDIVFLNRINVGLNSILAGLGARNHWRRIAEEFWTGAPARTELGVAEQRWLGTRPPASG